MDSEIKNIPLKDILADDDFNCRGQIAPIDVVDLAKDIEIRGLIQPVVVVPHDSQDYKFRLIAGFRRYTAHKVIERKDIQCIIRKDVVNEADARFFNLAENIQRKELNVLQEAFALAKLKNLGISETDCGERLGKSRGWVQIRYMLLALPHEVQQEVAAGFIAHSQIRDLYTVLKDAGKEACFDATRKIKDAKILGKKVSVSAKNKNPKTKRHRTRGEIFEMMEHIQDTIGNGLFTRCMAWCAGEISNADLYISCREYAEKEGKTWQIPA